MSRKIGLRENFSGQGDEYCGKQKCQHSGQHGVGQQHQKYIDADISPENCGQQEIRIPPQRQNPLSPPIVFGGFDLQPDQAHAKKGQVKAGEHGILGNTEYDTDPNQPGHAGGLLGGAGSPGNTG